MGVGHKAVRKRAVGTRERIIAYLTEAGELFDANGMASTQLAAAVGYPGSSVAFAQLLSGMERSALIDREVRGKRTYRIRLGPAHVAGPGGDRACSRRDRAGRGPGGGGDGRPRGRRDGRLRLRRAGPAPAGAGGQAAGRGRPRGEHGGRFGCTGSASPSRSARPPDQLATPDQLALQETVSGLEYELATAWTKHGKLAEENVRLREQLRAAQRSLALAAEQVRRLPTSTDLDSREVVLLQQLLTSAPAADSTDDSGAEAPSLLR